MQKDTISPETLKSLYEKEKKEYENAPRLPVEAFSNPKTPKMVLDDMNEIFKKTFGI